MPCEFMDQTVIVPESLCISCMLKTDFLPLLSFHVNSYVEYKVSGIQLTSKINLKNLYL